MIPVSYLQTDPRWSSIGYSTKNEGSTIGSAGCGPTCMAMILASLKNKSITPKETAKWSVANGFKIYHQGTAYAFFNAISKLYGISVEQVNYSSVYGKRSDAHAKALAAIKDGNWVICCMGPGNWTSQGHFILWYGVDGARALIRDPNSTAYVRTHGTVELLQRQAKYYWIVKVETGEDELAKIIEQIAASAGCTTEMAIMKLGLLVKFQDDFSDAYQQAGVKALQDKGLISVARDGRSAVNWGDFGTVVSRLK